MAESYGKDGSVEHENYCMSSPYKRNVNDMNEESRYPAWNSRADKQAEYPMAKMEGAKRNMQPMGKAE